MERCFILELVRKVESGSYNDGQPFDDAIHSAVAFVTVVFGMNLTFNIGLARLNYMKERHEMFSWLINRPSVRWITRPNIVLVNESLWDDIGREKPSALAYWFDTEPAWEELKIIFDVPENELYHPSDDEVYPQNKNLQEEIEVRMPSEENENSEGESTVDKA
ncbi:hypothetical protein Salat_1714200 [Sesamum alatum]|uniref:Uncharacterized protein n=1 Tax=Sesamum alatum TaxID=300844 RepID=A0AAE1Y8V2_9LAMI|nr:hypothetical protein Salat_1714200 [Sesamum alatum]